MRVYLTNTGEQYSESLGVSISIHLRGDRYYGGADWGGKGFHLGGVDFYFERAEAAIDTLRRLLNDVEAQARLAEEETA